MVKQVIGKIIDKPFDVVEELVFGPSETKDEPRIEEEMENHSEENIGIIGDGDETEDETIRKSL